jgi:hypothetical protein
MRKTKALDATANVKRGSNIMAILQGEAEKLGAAVREKTGELSDAKIKIGEALRDRIVAGEICANVGDANVKGSMAAAKKANQLEANQYARWAYPELKTVESAGVRTSQLLSFALANVVETKPDYRGAFRKWVEATPSKARGGSDYFDSCVKLNRLVQKEPKAKLVPAFFVKAHAKKEPAVLDKAGKAKAAEKAREKAKSALIDAAKLLRKDRGIEADVKAAIDALLATFA